MVHPQAAYSTCLVSIHLESSLVDPDRVVCHLSIQCLHHRSDKMYRFEREVIFVLITLLRQLIGTFVFRDQPNLPRKFGKKLAVQKSQLKVDSDIPLKKVI